jgi:hypothetical protein
VWSHEANRNAFNNLWTYQWNDCCIWRVAENARMRNCKKKKVKRLWRRLFRINKTYRLIARQRIGKHIPAEAYARNNRTSIARQRIGKQVFVNNIEAVFSPWPVPRGYKGTKNVVWESGCRVLEMAVEGEWKEIARNKFRLCKEDFMYDLKLQWDGYEFVARIRLVKTENPSACVKVNCNVCRSAIVLYYL